MAGSGRFTAYRGGQRRARFKLPPTKRSVGRPADPQVWARGYRALVRRGTGETLGSMADDFITVRQNVSVSINRFLERAPGAWDLMFPGMKGNSVRQRLAPLPLSLQPLIESGKRDPLIQRLHLYGMTAADIARVTGASLDRINAVLARVSRESANGGTAAEVKV
jgi:hypothetical protein